MDTADPDAVVISVSDALKSGARQIAVGGTRLRTDQSNVGVDRTSQGFCRELIIAIPPIP